MVSKKLKRQKRARKGRARISQNSSYRMTVFRSNSHIYAQVMNNNGSQVLAVASSNEPSFKKKSSGNIESASIVGKVVAERALEKGINEVAFDRSGYKFHGRVKALAEAAREAGLKF